MLVALTPSDAVPGHPYLWIARVRGASGKSAVSTGYASSVDDAFTEVQAVYASLVSRARLEKLFPASYGTFGMRTSV
jgi:hypothetical protein